MGKYALLFQEICPGVVKTDFFYNMTKDEQRVRNLYKDSDFLQSEDIAASVLHALSVPANVDVSGDILIEKSLKDF